MSYSTVCALVEMYVDVDNSLGDGEPSESDSPCGREDMHDMPFS